MQETLTEKDRAKENVAAKADGDQQAEPLINRIGMEADTKKQATALLASEIPNSLTGRYGLVTAKAIGHLPEGVMNSVVHAVKNPLETAETLAMGAGMAVVLKTVLPETGAAGKIASLAIGGYFMYKASEPIVAGYKSASEAQSMAALDKAAAQIGDAGGAFLVNGAIAYGGYKIGAHYTDKMLATPRGQAFTQAKANFYDGLTDKVVNTTLNVSESIGLTKPRSSFADVKNPNGAIPPYMLEEMAKRNAENPDFAKTRQLMAELDKEPRSKIQPRSTSDQLGQRQVSDAQGQETHPGVRGRWEGEKPTGNAEVDTAYDFSGTVRDFYQQKFNRLSIDGKGMNYESTVNYGKNFENAFWDGQRMTYGRPGPDSPFKTFQILDVAGHEVTHGITEMEAGTVYRNQSGALNESYSDVFGSLIKQFKLNQTADKADWLVGEGIWRENIKGRALRDMKNPGTAYNDPAIGKDPQPAHMKDYNKTRGDNGGVHYNSGIPNRAFATFAEDVGGFAYDGPGKIWWAARKAAGSNPNFGQFAHHTIEQAKLLGFTDMVPKLQKAWDTVGVKPGLTAADLPAPVMPTGGETGTDTGKLPPLKPVPEHIVPRKAG